LAFLNVVLNVSVSQQAKREVQKFVDKMVTGKEAWADVQWMKQAAGQLPGTLLSVITVNIYHYYHHLVYSCYH